MKPMNNLNRGKYKSTMHISSLLKAIKMVLYNHPIEDIS